MKSAFLQSFISSVIFVLVLLGLLLSALFAFFALVFFGNFNFSNNWHLFVFCYTFAAPVVSLVGLIAHRLRRSRVTAFGFLVSTLAPFLILFLWSAEGSRGLIH